MATRVKEIMNRELYAARKSDTVGDVIAGLLALGITSGPVLDDAGRVAGIVSLRDLVGQAPARPIAEVMTVPATVVPTDATLHEVGHLLAMTGCHHLPVVDELGRAVGFVSALDVIRGIFGVAVPHPSAFPHFDTTNGVAWTDETELEVDRIEVAPDGPGVLVLVSGQPDRADSIVWVEGPNNVRSRLLDLVSLPQSEEPLLARLLDRGGLRFRATAAQDPLRKRLVDRLLDQSAA